MPFCNATSDNLQLIRMLKYLLHMDLFLLEQHLFKMLETAIVYDLK